MARHHSSRLPLLAIALTLLAGFVAPIGEALCAQRPVPIPPPDSAPRVRTDTGSLAGRVRDDTERPIANARVRDAGSGRLALSDHEGRFHLAGLPVGAHVLEITAIGYAAARGEVEIRRGLRAQVVVTLESVVVEGVTRLDSVVVLGEGVTREAPQEFVDRLREGWATRYFTADEIARRNPVYTTNLLTLIPGVRIVGSGPRASIVPGRGSMGACARIFLDGYPMRQDEINMVPPSTLSGVEFYYGALAPPQYARGNPCAVLLLWTKHDRAQR